MIETILRTLARFLMGPVAIVAVLKIVSGDQHIIVVAPTAALIVWFIIWVIWELESQPKPPARH